MTTPHGTASEYEKAQREEWGRYVASVPIDYYGVRAYNTGDPVPVSAVEGATAWVPETLVSKTTGKGGTDAFTDSPTVVDPGPPTIDESTVAAPAASSPITTTEG